VTIDDRLVLLQNRIAYLSAVWHEARQHRVLAETVRSLRDELERGDRELLRLTRALKEEVAHDVWSAAVAAGMRRGKKRGPAGLPNPPPGRATRLEGRAPVLVDCTVDTK
jgi:hypothetical protein